MSEPKPSLPLTHIEEVLPILNKIAIFGGFNDKQLYEIFRLLEVVSYEANEVIYKRGDDPSHIYIVRSGEVKIILDLDNVSMELLSLKEGHCFGEASVIGIQPHSSNAVAVVDTELIVVEKKALLNIYEHDKELFGLLILNIARETSRHLYQADVSLARYLSSQNNHKK